MAEPGQGAAHPEIIDRPKLKSPFRHFVEGSVTLTLWAVWLYWILPILTIFLWLLGVRFFYYKIFLGRSLIQLLEVMKEGAIAILLIFILNLFWISYNYRFIFKRVGERRKQVRKCTDKMVADFFKIDLGILEKAKKERLINLTLTDKGFIITT